ncbi:Mor transcription activator family protein [Lachnospiraceae bacterium 54-11]
MVVIKDTLLISDLPEPLRGYADAVGLENLKKLAQQSGGKSIYIPTEECLNKYSLKRQIIEDHKNGQRIKALSEKYGLSITTIYRYLND